mmetsp:Transcript_115828/g.227198  ORF Transcript_115828/g.227198 Transcript_115828/m.227198 type:complete len:98 (-) Transcript_115828:2819-3112(-)
MSRITVLGAGEYAGLGVRVIDPPFRDAPGEGRKPGDKPIGVPEAEKKLVCLGVEGGGARVDSVAYLETFFLGDSSFTLHLVINSDRRFDKSRSGRLP